MLKYLWRSIFVLAMGCSSPERESESGTPWIVNEQPTLGTDDSSITEEPPIIVLRASNADPHYGTRTDFFEDFFGIRPHQKRCSALIITFDLQFEEDVIVVLPREITQTSDKYGLEILRFEHGTWVLPALNGGEVWAFKAHHEPHPNDDFGPATIQVHSSPFVEETTPITSGATHLLICGSAPEGLLDSIIQPPELIEVEIWSTDESIKLPMKAEIQQTTSGITYTYRGIE